MDLPPSSEIIIQGYTCVALPNAIHAAGYTPVFVDIDKNTLNMDSDSVSAKISSRTKVIICQHTFGLLADTEALRIIADKHNLLLIEDCAHVLPDVTGPKIIGKHADALMLSFGRDKAASGVAGGAIVSKNDSLTEILQREESRATEVRMLTVMRYMLYPLLYALAKPLYGIRIGKACMGACAKLKMLVPVLSKKEKTGYQSTALKRMPNACCALVASEFKRFHSINNHRRMLTAFYREAAIKHNWKHPEELSGHLPMQKFPLFVPDADEMRSNLKQKNIYLDDGWTSAAICPPSVDQEAAGYVGGSCPQAERTAQEILSLPTHPTMTQKQAKHLCSLLSALYSS